MNQKPPFTDLINERHPLEGFTPRRLVIALSCLFIFTSAFLGVKKVLQINQLKEKQHRQLIISENHSQNLQHQLNYKARQISELEMKMADLEERFPTGILVKSGDTHYQLAMDYLTEKEDLPQEEAQEVIKAAVLFPHLSPGQKVWHFYHQGQLGSFITQGESHYSPGYTQSRIRNKQVAAYMNLLAVKNRLSENIESLKNQNQILFTKLAQLQQDHQKITTQYATLSNQVIRLQSKAPSVPPKN